MADVEPRAPAGLWNRPFVLVCLAIFLAYAHQALLTPTLPLYIESFDNSVVMAGLVLGAYAAVSLLSRPFVGYWSDRWSLSGMLLVGMLFLVGGSLALLIPWLATVFTFNAIRGAGWAAINTAGYVVVAYVAPPARRGEASGYYSIATNSAFAFAPAVGLWLLGTPGMGFNAVLLLAAGCAALGLVSAWLMPPVAPPHPQHHEASPSKTEARGLAAFFDPGMLLASLLLLCLTLTQTASGPFVPLYAREIGVDNAAGYFVAQGTVSLLSRPTFGRFLDMGSRAFWIVIGYVASIAGFGILVVASSPLLMVIAGVVAGIGAGIANTILFVVAMDRADPQRVGTSMATFSSAYQVGGGLGAPLTGLLIELVGYRWMFLAMIAALSVGILLTAVNWRSLGKPAVAMRGGRT